MKHNIHLPKWERFRICHHRDSLFAFRTSPLSPFALVYLWTRQRFLSSHCLSVLLSNYASPLQEFLSFNLKSSLESCLLCPFSWILEHFLILLYTNWIEFPKMLKKIMRSMPLLCKDSSLSLIPLNRTEQNKDSSLSHCLSLKAPLLWTAPFSRVPTCTTLILSSNLGLALRLRVTPGGASMKIEKYNDMLTCVKVRCIYKLHQAVKL